MVTFLISEPVVEDEGESNSPLWDDDQESTDEHEDQCSGPELVLTCFILMLDILYKQVRFLHVIYDKLKKLLFVL